MREKAWIRIINKKQVKKGLFQKSSNSSKINTNTTENNQKSLNKTSNNTQSVSDSQMSRYITFYQQYHDVDKLIALVSQDHSDNETQKIVNQICGKY